MRPRHKAAENHRIATRMDLVPDGFNEAAA